VWAANIHTTPCLAHSRRQLAKNQFAVCHLGKFCIVPSAGKCHIERTRCLSRQCKLDLGKRTWCCKWKGANAWKVHKRS
jgi:hypothetical protein